VTPSSGRERTERRCRCADQLDMAWPETMARTVAGGNDDEVGGIGCGHLASIPHTVRERETLHGWWCSRIVIGSS
jgi:hypothetical protein